LWRLYYWRFRDPIPKLPFVPDFHSAVSIADLSSHLSTTPPQPALFLNGIRCGCVALRSKQPQQPLIARRKRTFLQPQDAANIGAWELPILINGRPAKPID
jgi:hypothetical protein